MTAKIFNDKGFTLIELIVVVVILGITAAIVATTGLKGGADSAALNAHTNQLISDLRLLQTRATAQNDGELSFRIISETEYKMDTFDDSVNLDKGVEISATSGSFSFKPDGTRSGPSNYEITLSVNGETKTVQVSQQGLVQLKNIQNP